eukprot:3900441-Heterocapsa_arctica.AAC.1
MLLCLGCSRDHSLQGLQVELHARQAGHGGDEGEEAHGFGQGGGQVGGFLLSPPRPQIPRPSPRMARASVAKTATAL